MKSFRISTTLNIVFLYAVTGAVWILLTDYILVKIVTNPTIYGQLASLKGVGYVVITSLLLLFILNKEDAQRTKIENQYQQLFAATPDPIFIFDQKGNLVEVNDQASTNYGYSRPELLNCNIQDLCAPELRTTLAVNLTQTENLPLGRFRWKDCRKNGEIFDVEISSRPIEWNGKPCTLSISRDITQSEELLKAFRDSEERYRLLVEQSPYGVMIIQGKNDNILFANMAATKLLGISSNENVIGQSVRNFLAADTANDVIETLKKLLNSDRPAVPFEITIRRIDGIAIPLQTSLVRFLYKGENAVQIILIDISDLINARQEQAHLLQQQQMILDRLPIACIVTDADGLITYWNPATKTLFGYESAEVLGKPSLGIIIPEESISTVMERRQRMANGDMSANGENVNITKSGRRVTCEWFNTPLFKGNQYNGYISMMIDVTERKLADVERANHLRHMQQLAQASLFINAASSRNEIMQIAIRSAAEITSAGIISISLTEPGTNRQAIQQYLLDGNYYIVDPEDDLSFAVTCLYQTVLKDLQSVIMTPSELAANASWQEVIVVPGSIKPLNGWLAAPLLSREGYCLGIFQAADRREESFSGNERAALVQLAQIMTAAMEKLKLLDQLREANERTRRVAQEVVTAQENERRNISDQLQNQVGQTLAAVKLNLEITIDSLPPGMEDLNSRLEEGLELTQDTLSGIREVTRALRPPRLDLLGLSASLDALCNEYSRPGQMEIQYQGTEIPSLSDAARVTLYRFLQEALLNISKYAAAALVQVNFIADNDNIYLSIQDDGVGLPVEILTDPAIKPGAGLRKIRERIELIGGQMVLYSANGLGTYMAAVLPFDTQPEPDPGNQPS